jgi:hypothetical protein
MAGDLDSNLPSGTCAVIRHMDDFCFHTLEPAQTVGVTLGPVLQSDRPDMVLVQGDTRYLGRETGRSRTDAAKVI